MTPYLNCISETVQMRGHNIHFYAELTKIHGVSEESPCTPSYLELCNIGLYKL